MPVNAADPTHRITPDGASFARRTLLTLAVRMRTEAREQSAGGELIMFMASDIWLMVLGFVEHDKYML